MSKRFATFLICMGMLCVFLSIGPAHRASAYTIVGWGSNDSGQIDVPAGNDYIAIAAGDYHSLALKHCEDMDGDSYTTCDGDCDDTDASSYPGATELYDGKDNDCDGTVPANEADEDEDGIRVCEGDYDDADSTVFAGAPGTFSNRYFTPILDVFGNMSWNNIWGNYGTPNPNALPTPIWSMLGEITSWDMC